ncbi:nodulation-signaling pathway 2 protein-like [Neltuma alba]|uniref:nodulation-signaling pathway 2 protein-like n=1 Tax=Neltuma alba TaxID=207710 RepID=UPI0010A4095F|nr:nodulation-signaling pathway 2 protein-like [Prosopis alba]
MGSEASKSIENSFFNEFEVSSVYLSQDNFQYQVDGEDILGISSMELDTLDPDLSTQFLNILGYPEESEETFHPSQNLSSEAEDSWSCSPSTKSSEYSSLQLASLNVPREDMEMDTRVILPHLLEAHVEARDQNQIALVEEILRCINQKTSPLAEDPLERLAFHYSSQNITGNLEAHFLQQEASKNFDPAFRVFYQSTPYGRFAHFVANSAIVEAIPEDSEAIHIIDFDMGEGVQWPPVIEAISQQNKALKLTSIKWETEQQNSEEPKRNLSEYARSCGLKTTIEEKSFEELVTELKKLNKRGGSARRDFLIFNCMVGLPHMGRGRSRRSVTEYLNLGKNMIRKNTCNRGIITFGDGEADEKLRNSLNFRSFFDGNTMHYKALMESIESNFPACFSQARTAIEFLFVEPYVSSVAWMKKWEELRGNCHFQAGNGFGINGRRLSEEILMEAREMLGGSREASCEARIEGQNGNEMVLSWKGKQLVKVSTWGSQKV